MENIIKRTDLIKDVFIKYPHLKQSFIKRSMRCVGCEVLDFETIEESCKNHCMDDIDEFVAVLNSQKDIPVSKTEEMID